MSTIIANTEFTVSMTDWAQNLYNFIHPYDNRITLVSEKLRFNNKFSLRIKDTTDANFYLVRDDDSEIDLTGDCGYWTNGSTAVVKLIIRENIFYISGYKKNDNNSGFAFMWITQDGVDYAGGYTQYGQELTAVDDMTFYDAVNASTSPFNFKKIANYIVQTPKIAFSSKTPFVNSGGEATQIDNLASCSTVAKSCTVTIGGKNYFAIGTNILIQID